VKGYAAANKGNGEPNRREYQTQQTSQYQAALQLMFGWRLEMISNPALAKHLKEEKYFGMYSPFSQ
jgi:hypothetical protein